MGATGIKDKVVVGPTRPGINLSIEVVDVRNSIVIRVICYLTLSRSINIDYLLLVYVSKFTCKVPYVSQSYNNHLNDCHDWSCDSGIERILPREEIKPLDYVSQFERTRRRRKHKLWLIFFIPYIPWYADKRPEFIHLT